MGQVTYADGDALMIKLWTRRLEQQAAIGVFGVPGWFVVYCLDHDFPTTLRIVGNHAAVLEARGKALQEATETRPN